MSKIHELIQFMEQQNLIRNGGIGGGGDIIIDLNNIEASGNYVNLAGELVSGTSGAATNASILNALLQQVAATKIKKIIFPTGTFYFDGTFDIPDDIEFLGDGTEFVFISTNATEVNGIETCFHIENKKNVVFQDIRFTLTDGQMFYAENPENLFFDGCVFNFETTTGISYMIFSKGLTNFTFKNCVFETATTISNDVYPYHFESNENQTVDTLEFINCAFFHQDKFLKIIGTLGFEGKKIKFTGSNSLSEKINNLISIEKTKEIIIEENALYQTVFDFVECDGVTIGFNRFSDDVLVKYTSLQFDKTKHIRIFSNDLGIKSVLKFLATSSYVYFSSNHFFADADCVFASTDSIYTNSSHVGTNTPIANATNRIVVNNLVKPI